MIDIFRYFKGFARVCISGDMAAQFLGACLKEEIIVWDIVKIDQSMYFNIYMCDYHCLRDIRKNFVDPIKIRCVKKTGFYSVIQYHLRRPGIVVGVLLFVAVNIFLSQFIWDIDVKGAVTVDEKEIFNVCNELGIVHGKNRNKIDTYNAKQVMATKVDGIAWVSLNIEGTKLTVNISEAKESDNKQHTTPCNLVAKFDGVIKKIEVVRGRKNVVVDQAVRKGDMLVSGVIENNENLHFVNSEGSVIARTERIYQENIEKVVTVNRYTGRTDNRKVLEFFWFRIPLYLSEIGYDHQAYTLRRETNFLSEELPITVYNRFFLETRQIELNTDSDIAERIALDRVYSKIKTEDILSVETQDSKIEPTSDGFKVTVTLTCLENIAQRQEIAAVNN